MMEEGVLNWEKILTVLIGIVIVATVYLIIYRVRKSKRRKIEREAALLKSDRQMQQKEKQAIK